MVTWPPRRMPGMAEALLVPGISHLASASLMQVLADRSSHWEEESCDCRCHLHEFHDLRGIMGTSGRIGKLGDW